MASLLTWSPDAVWVLLQKVWWFLVVLGVLVAFHEFGHFLFYRAFGFQGAVLHYSSTNYSLEKTVWQLINRGNLAAAASMIPLWKVGIATAAGILVTYVVALGCLLFAARKSPHPLVVALGVFAPVRFLAGAKSPQANPTQYVPFHFGRG